MGATTDTGDKGRAVVSIAEGECLGTIARAYVHQTDKCIVGFGVDPGTSWREPDRAYLIDTDRVVSLGPDVLTIADRTELGGQAITAAFDRLVEFDELNGRSVFTENGEHLGTVSRIDLDPETLRLTAVAIAAGRGQSPREIPIDRVTTLGAGVVVVSGGTRDARSQARSPSGDGAFADHPRPSAGNQEGTMNNARLTGLAVVSIADGEKVGVVSSIVLDLADRRIAHLEVESKGGLLSPSGPHWLLDTADVHAIGPDALTIADRSALKEDLPVRGDVVLLPVGEFLKRKVVTEGGTFVGTVASVEFDEHSRRMTQIEASPGFFKHNRMIPIDQVGNLGNEIVIVADAVCADAEEAPAAPSEEHRWVVGDIEPTRSQTASGS
jgi:sporulation protein YlmC with PRC-barrel domain